MTDKSPLALAGVVFVAGVLAALALLILGEKAEAPPVAEVSAPERAAQVEARASVELEAQGVERVEASEVLPGEVDQEPAVELEQALETEQAPDEAEEALEPEQVFVIAMRALDHEGRAMANSELELRLLRAIDAEGEPASKLRASTDDAGRIEFGLASWPEGLEADAARIEALDGDAFAVLEELPLIQPGRTDLGDVTLSEPRDLNPAALVRGSIVSTGGGRLKQLNGWVSPTETAVPEGRRSDGQLVFDAEAGEFAAYGPEAWRSVNLAFMAENHEFQYLSDLEAPRAGLDVVLQAEFRLEGQLVVPSEGPPVPGYSVWVHQEGSGTGISVRSNGKFSVGASANSLSLSVRFPSMGYELFVQEFVIAPDGELELGVIDVRPHVQVLNVLIADASGNPLGGGKLQVRAADVELVGAISRPYIEVDLDAEGRALLVLPIEVGRVGLRIEDGEEVEYDIGTLPGLVRLP